MFNLKNDKKYKIAFLGNFDVDFSSENHYAKTLEKLGYEVVRLQEPVTTTDRLLFVASQCDILLWVHTHDCEMNGNISIEDVLTKLKEKNIPTVAYHLDLYMGIKRWNSYFNHPYFKVEYFFTVDKLMADWLNEHTQTKGIYLPAGVFEPECYLAEPKDEYKYDVIFVGSKQYHPEWQYRQELINRLQAKYGSRFGHFGKDGIKALRGDELNKLYASAKVAVGDTLCLGFDYPYYWSDRVYETTGRGGMIIHPYVKGLEDEFVENEEIMFYKYNNFYELFDKIDYLLEHNEKREQIRLNGFKRTSKTHTYTNRLQTILDTVFGDKK